MEKTQPRQPKSRIFYGWWVVLACGIVSAYCAGMFFYSASALFNPIREEFGWMAATTAVIFSMRGMESGFAAPAVGFVVDRFGARAVMLCGVVVLGVGAIALSQIQSLWALYATYALVALGLSLVVPVPGITATASWFVRRRGIALGAFLIAPGVGGITVPLFTWLITTCGWRTTLIIAAGVLWLIAVPLLLIVVKSKPEKYGYLPDGDPSPPNPIPAASTPTTLAELKPKGQELSVPQILRSSSFWLISLALAAASFSTYAVFAFEIPALVHIGVSTGLASLMVTLTTVSSIAGRFGLGWLSGHFNKKLLVAVLLVIQCLGVLMLAYAQHLWQVILFVVAFGPAYGGIVTMRPVLQGHFFGSKAFGTVQGLLMGIMTVGGLVSPVFTGWMFDMQGSYRMAFMLLALLCLAGIPLILTARPPSAPSRAN